MKLFIYFSYLTFYSSLFGLDFQKTKISHPASLKETSYTATYHFTNNNLKEINILKLTPSCNCLAPELSKKSYKPGEKGEIKLVFDFKNKKGLQQNRLLVFVSGDKKPITLVLEVDIPYPYKYSQRFLIWKEKDRDQKNITMTFHRDLSAKVSLVPVKKDFPFKVDVLDQGNGLYNISTKPDPNILKGRYTFNLELEEKDKLPKISTLYLIIQ